MDTSETYIKMCEKAEEIQESHDYIKGDYMLSIDWELHTQLAGKIPFTLVTNPMTHTETTIWLPRQDQLQEMIDDDWLYAFELFVGEFCEVHDGEIFSVYAKQFNSLEQLWLAFVMKERYGKVWDSDIEQWVKPIEFKEAGYPRINSSTVT